MPPVTAGSMVVAIDNRQPTGDNGSGRDSVIDTVKALRQHQLVILRRMRNGPLTEFELIHEVAEHSGYSQERCADKMGEWLEELRDEGLVWAGSLSNADGQKIMAAALTKRGRELVH